MKMTDKDLIKQLNSLQSVKADPKWAEDSREVLKLQVYNGRQAGNIGFFAKLHILTSRLFQPAGVAALIVIFFVMSGIFGLSASGQARPGDTLYIAKVISEKAQLAVTFNDKSKSKLNLKFANNRVEEIKDLLNRQSGDEQAIEELKNDFKHELDSVRSRLSQSNQNQEETPLPPRPKTDKQDQEPVDDTGGIASLPDQDDSGESDDIANEETEQDDEYFTAGSGKDNTRLDLNTGEDKDSLNTEDSAKPSQDRDDEQTKPVEPSKDAEQIIREAEALLDQGKYEEAGAKLDELNSLIESE